MKLSVLIAALRLRHLAGAALLSTSLAAYALPAGLAQGPLSKASLNTRWTMACALFWPQTIPNLRPPST